MNELKLALDQLFSCGNAPLVDGIFQNCEVVDRAVGLCEKQLITEGGGCAWDNIQNLRDAGYRVFAEEKDSFGWLTSCVQKSGDRSRTLVYGKKTPPNPLRRSFSI